MILRELFQNSVPIKWNPNMSFSFNINGKTYTGGFFMGMRSDGMRNPEFEFRLESNGTDTPEGIGITNTGDEVVVFSTVLDVLRHAMEHFRFQSIMFPAKISEPSRTKLYDRICRRLSNETGWRLEVDNGSTFRWYELFNPEYDE